jgi:S-adenosylmethionine-diacylgycerolhomoserine-N-methlytransferase
MINPGFAGVLRLSLEDLAPRGYLAVVDFHDTPLAGFRSWMGVNHVRMDGQVLAALQESGLQLGPCQVTPAYWGAWRWLLCIARH